MEAPDAYVRVCPGDAIAVAAYRYCSRLRANTTTETPPFLFGFGDTLETLRLGITIYFFNEYRCSCAVVGWLLFHRIMRRKHSSTYCTEGAIIERLPVHSYR
jgi:hypothetical protein